MHCLFHSASDDPDSCLLGGKETACKAFKCLQTVGKPCSNGHEVRLTGNECAKSLACGKSLCLIFLTQFKFFESQSRLW